jgi:hypothetical protein
MGTAAWALLISVLSFLVAGGSLWVAISAKRQAGRVGVLEQRIKAVEHLQNALADLRQGDPSLALNAIREAQQLAAFVFSRKLRSELTRVDEKIERLSRGQSRFSLAVLQDYPDLQEHLQSIIYQMKKEGSLSGPIRPSCSALRFFPWRHE